MARVRSNENASLNRRRFRASPGAARAVQPQGQLGLTDKFGNKVACAEGTIPMRRITLEELTRFTTLQQFFRRLREASRRRTSAAGTASASRRFTAGRRSTEGVAL
jgi:hypothetical protein